MPKYNCELPKVRVYKGSRYIPKWADPLQHDPNREYEPLEVVYSCGKTFISKTDVPVGVGLPEEPELQNQWWATYADYNAQLEMYRAEVREFSTRYDRLFCYLKDRLEKLEQKVEQYYQELKQDIADLRQWAENKFEETKNYIDQQISQVNNRIENLENRVTVVEQTGDQSVQDIVNKVYGGGTVNENGSITWPNSDKIAIGNMNWYAGDNAEQHIRTRADGNNDMWGK